MAKRKMKFNIIDAVILCILALAVAVLLYVFVFSDSTTDDYETYNVECVMEISSINELFRDSIQDGQTVMDAKLNKIGTVTKPPEIRPTIITAFDEETESEKYTEAEGLIDFYVTFTGEAEKTEWGYKFVDSHIAVNEQVRLQFSDMQCNATCVKMTVLD